MKRLIFFLIFTSVSVFSQELVIGEERVSPGINIIFEGAIRDKIYPSNRHLDYENSNVHIEARVNWDYENIPKGAPSGGFVAYLSISAKIINQENDLKTFVDLVPELNMIDNFHYARNIYLPGGKNDLYTIEFYINPPENSDLAFHMDWTKIFGNKLIDNHTFIYKNINFLEIVNGKRAY